MSVPPADADADADANGCPPVEMIHGDRGTTAEFAITNSGCVNEKLLTADAPPTSTWKHVAIVLSGSTGELHIDGGFPVVKHVDDAAARRVQGPRLTQPADPRAGRDHQGGK